MSYHQHETVLQSMSAQWHKEPATNLATGGADQKSSIRCEYNRDYWEEFEGRTGKMYVDRMN